MSFSVSDLIAYALRYAVPFASVGVLAYAAAQHNERMAYLADPSKWRPGFVGIDQLWLLAGQGDDE